VAYAAPAAALGWPADKLLLKGRAAAALRASGADVKAVAASFVVRLALS
jgi:hypothetical protein